MNIRIGAPIIASNGNAGRVAGMILHPETNELQGIVAELSGMLPYDVVVPAERIVLADEDGLQVRATVAQVGEMEPFAQSQYVTPPEDWIPPLGGAATHYLFPASPYAVGAFTLPSVQSDPAEHEVENLDAGDVEVSGSTTVYFSDGGTAGHVDQVITDADSDRVTHLVVKRSGRDVAVPVDRIARMDGTGVHLTVTDDELDSLPAGP